MKRAFAALLTIIILGFIFARVDRQALWTNLLATRPVPFLAALLLFIPQNFISIWRWRAMASLFIPMNWMQATGLILAGNTMNIILPSKMGDLTKAYFLHQAGAMDLPRAINLVVFEKMLDLASLCLLAVAGVLLAHLLGVQVGNKTAFAALSLLSAGIGSAVLAIVVALYFIPAEKLPLHARLERLLGTRPVLAPLKRTLSAGHEVMAMLQARHARRWLVCCVSVLLWMLHLLQIYCFFLALNAPVPLLAFAALMPLAIFVGLLPISLFGMGTRDAAIITFFGPYQPAAKLLGVGLYVSLRYLVPAVSGLPFLGYYTGLVRRRDQPRD